MGLLAGDIRRVRLSMGPSVGYLESWALKEWFWKCSKFLQSLYTYNYLRYLIIFITYTYADKDDNDFIKDINPSLQLPRVTDMKLLPTIKKNMHYSANR